MSNSLDSKNPIIRQMHNLHADNEKSWRVPFKLLILP